MRSNEKEELMPTAIGDLPAAVPFDPNAPEFLADPYPTLRELRQQTPV